MITINRELYDYLYNEMGAEYSKDPEGVALNVDNDEDKNLKYLGTYFPRSFVEAYYIYDNIFSNEDVFERFDKKKKIRILDIGSGTGGNLVGLLQNLFEKFTDKEIEIISIDGNDNALDLQLRIVNNLEEFMDYNGNELSGNLHHIKFENKNEIEEKLDMLSLENSLDIIHSFKFVNEFYKTDYDLNKGMYINFMYLANKWLRKSGILCLVDITNKVGNLGFMSIIFNEEVRKYFLNEKSELIYIIPKCCAINYEICNKKTNCFSRLEFGVEFDNRTDISKVNYKLFVKNKLGKKLRDKIMQDYCNYETCYCRDSQDKYNCTKERNEPYQL